MEAPITVFIQSLVIIILNTISWKSVICDLLSLTLEVKFLFFPTTWQDYWYIKDVPK